MRSPNFLLNLPLGLALGALAAFGVAWMLESDLEPEFKE